jgi:hypothetical protein
MHAILFLQSKAQDSVNLWIRQKTNKNPLTSKCSPSCFFIFSVYVKKLNCAYKPTIPMERSNREHSDEEMKE